MGNIYALRATYIHHLRLLFRKGFYLRFPFAYLPSTLVLAWIASRSDDPAVVQYIAYGAFILTMWNQFLTVTPWVLRDELFEGTFALTVLTRTPVIVMVLGASLANATLALVFGVLAFITVLLISGQPLDASNATLLAMSFAVALLAIFTTGFLLSPLAVLRRGVGGLMSVFIQMGTVFGGILFPVALLPESLRFLSWLLPSSWAMQRHRGFDPRRGGNVSSIAGATSSPRSSLAALYAALALPPGVQKNREAPACERGYRHRRDGGRFTWVMCSPRPFCHTRACYLWLNWQDYTFQVLVRPSLMLALYVLAGRFAGAVDADTYMTGLIAYAIPAGLFVGIFSGFLL